MPTTSSTQNNQDNRPRCTKTHHLYNEVRDKITNIFLTSDGQQCTPTGFKNLYPDLYSQFQEKSINNLITRVKAKLKKEAREHGFDYQPEPEQEAHDTIPDQEPEPPAQEEEEESREQDEISPSSSAEETYSSFESMPRRSGRARRAPQRYGHDNASGKFLFILIFAIQYIQNLIH